MSKNVYDKFYFPKNDKSEGNEISFIRFLENNDNVVWWHKQGNHGKNYFSIIYKEKDEIDRTRFVNALFYPDWIIKTINNEIWIIDTKSGFISVLNNVSSQQKLKSFCKWFKENKNYKGGIVEPQGNEWYLLTQLIQIIIL